MQKTKPFTSLAVLMTLLIVCFIGLFQFTSHGLLYVDWFIILAAIAVMNFMSITKNFILILSVILIFGFFLLFYSFFRSSPLNIQIMYIVQQILLAASLILIWLLFNQIIRLREQLASLKHRVKELEKFEGSSNLLTVAEFSSRASLIKKGTKRRGEENCYILFTVSKSGKTNRSMNHLLSEALLKTVRAQYDLVTDLRNDSFLVFLQNTKEDGCYIVIDRLFKLLRSQLNLIELPIKYEFIKEDEMSHFEQKSGIKELDIV